MLLDSAEFVLNPALRFKFSYKIHELNSCCSDSYVRLRLLRQMHASGSDKSPRPQNPRMGNLLGDVTELVDLVETLLVPSIRRLLCLYTDHAFASLY